MGKAAVPISGIVANADFTETNNCPASLAPGATCTVLVVFKPAAGIRSGAVSIIDPATNSPQMLSLAGLGLAPQ